MTVEINKQEAVFFKLDKLGILNFNIYLLKREEIEIIPLENTVKEYIEYKTDYSTLNEDTVVGESSVNVKDSSYYNIGDTIRIRNFVAEIIDIDSDNNLYLNKTIDDVYVTDEEVKIVLYPDLLGSYFLTFSYDKVGNYNLIISNKDENIFLIKPIEFVENIENAVVDKCNINLVY